jgi:predicted transcriptional regulator
MAGDAGQQRRAKVLEVLQRAERPLHTSVVATACGLDIRSANQVLNMLVKEGVLQKSKSGGRSAHYGEKERRWRVRPVQEAG